MSIAFDSDMLTRGAALKTERNLEWDPTLIDAIDNDTLFLLPPERVAEELGKLTVDS